MIDYALKARQLFQKHFPKFGSMVKSCTYKFRLSPTYNDTTGVVTNPTSPTQSLGVIFDKFDTEKVDGITILEIDKIAIFPTLDILGSNVVSIDDTITEGSDEWVVKRVISDPASVAYELHIRPRVIA